MDIASTKGESVLRKKEFDPEDALEANLLSGAVAGAIAESVLHPFDTVSTRLKAQRGTSDFVRYRGFRHACQLIWREERFRGFFGGFRATLITAAPTSAMYFGTYEYVKSLPSASFLESYEAPVHLFAGAMSEFVISFIVVPFEVVKSRLQMGCNPHRSSGGWLQAKSNYSGVFDGFRQITRKEGVAALYNGYRACLSTDCTFSALQFCFYEQLKASVRTRQFGEPLSASQILVVGGIAGVLAAVASNPLDVITMRLMVQEENVGGARSYHGMLDTAQRIVRDEGFQGIWRGSIPRALALAPLTAISFASFELTKRFLASDIDDI